MELRFQYVTVCSVIWARRILGTEIYFTKLFVPCYVSAHNSGDLNLYIHSVCVCVCVFVHLFLCSTWWWLVRPKNVVENNRINSCVLARFIAVLIGQKHSGAELSQIAGTNNSRRALRVKNCAVLENYPAYVVITYVKNTFFFLFGYLSLEDGTDRLSHKSGDIHLLRGGTQNSRIWRAKLTYSHLSRVLEGCGH